MTASTSPAAPGPATARAPGSAPGYPPARRAGLVDDLHGHRVPDPYRWLEDAASAETQEWLRAQDELWARDGLQAGAEGGRPGRSRLAARIQELMAAGFVSAPVWRGPRQFFMRRLPGQEHGVLLTAAPGEPERVLIDPAALDPDGLTTLDSWQPDQEGRLLGLPAVLRRGRGVGAPGAGRRVRRAGGRADQPLPLLPGRLAAGREGVLLRPQAPAGPGPGGRAAVSPPGVPAHGRRRHRGGRPDLRCGPGQDELLRCLGQPGRPLAGDLGRPGHRAPQRRVARRPGRLRAGRAAAGGGTGGGGRPDRAAPGPGRPAVRLHRCGRAARQARGGGSGRPGPVPLARPDRPGSGCDPERLRHPGRRRAQPAGAGRLLDQARDQRDHRA